jgi:murein DD-endopeptidase MepM/ murein hydrolase activator NlpD
MSTLSIWKNLGIISVILIAVSVYSFSTTTEARVTLTHSPDQVIQGEPVEIILKGTKKTDQVSVMFNNVQVPMTVYKKMLVGFVPISITKDIGNYNIQANVGDKVLKDSVQVIKREKYEAPLGIPKKLGGNTAASQKQLVDTLAIENQGLLNLGTNPNALWKKAFIFPVYNPVVTDNYGYSRLTGAYTITHKGTDFRAPLGTEVFAVNDGVVKIARSGRNYGNTIVIDHGQGIMSFYMHLSKMNVRVGDTITRGDTIGLSGQTGYAEAAHLHFTLRINDTSIDPIVFLSFFK